MAIKATCPSCGSVFNFGDQHAGKKVKCKNCEAAILIPAADPDEEEDKIVADDDRIKLRAKKKSGDSARAREDDEDEDDEDRNDRRDRSVRKKSKNQGSNKTLFIILGVVGGVLLLCCGGSIVGFVIVANKTANAAKDFAKKLEEEMKKQQQMQQKGNVIFEEKVVGKLLLTQNDTINPNDPVIAVDRGNGIFEKKRAKSYDVQFTQGKTYIITMKQAPGSMLDPFLVLSDPGGKSVAHDDDSGGFPNARISYPATMAGQYRITATSFGNSSGAFTLTVEER